MPQMPEYKDTVSLIPYGLPQFLDFETAPEKGKRVRMAFLEQTIPGSDGKSTVQLRELERDKTDGFLLNPDGKGEYGGEDYYELQADKHLKPWLGQWMPVPFLRQSGDTYEDGLPRFRPGPTNWARAYVTQVPSEEDPEVLNWRIVLAFDMQVEEQQNQMHAALTPDDVTACAVCSLADKERDNSWFLTEGWVDGWLKSVWEKYFLDKNHKRDLPRRADGEGESHLAYLASYLLYLKFLQSAIRHLKVRIINLAGTQDKAADSQNGDTIDVDLILDIGNSRSTGILVENQLNKTTDLNDSYRLQLRDLTQPYRFYSEPFETRVEFSKAEFGSQAFSKRSGRKSNAFTWVSPIRTGPEATRLGNSASNAYGASGMTSPKRYLWDQEDEASNLWYFSRSAVADKEELVSSHVICKFLNNIGTPVSCVSELNPLADNPPPKRYLTNLFQATLPGCKKQDALPANQPRFSRSSMMMFLFMELIQQALVTINSPAQRNRRAYPDKPRRLRSVIFTVPPGMPFAEQRIYRRWAHAAINVLWEALGWKKIFYTEPTPKGERSREGLAARDFRMNPEIRCSWDEATCTQLVYLYNEINRNYQGDAHLFFEIMGRFRNVPKETDPRQTESKPTLRIATIDIGGGSTDLSIITYVLANDKSSTNRIWPQQEMRDGFNLGGDDVLKAVVSDIVCKAFVDNLVKQGVSQKTADMAIREMFGKKSDNISIQNQRIKFLRLVALPIAYEILRQYESLSLQDLNAEINIPLGELFRNAEDEGAGQPYPDALNKVMAFFRETLETSCGTSLDVFNLDLNIRCADVDKTVANTVRSVLNGMGEVISAYDCDLLLLTGRPSLWNAVVRQTFAMLPVAPDRIIPMHKYLVGPWYPFASSSGKIIDPKTTVVTGAILCTLAQNSIEGFAFNSHRLSLKSTANYIGELDNHGSLPREKVWFPNENPNKAKGEDRYTRIVEFSAPITIGFRQLEVPRWTAQRCWSMEFTDEAARMKAEGNTPYEVKVQYVIPEKDEDLDYIPESGKDLRARLDEPQIAYEDSEAVQRRKISDGQMELEPVPGKPVRIRLRTLSKRDEDGCWMDTGILFN